MKLLIDTDIGVDVDDALAIYAAFQYPQVEVVSITTVFKNVDERARIAKKLLKLLNLDVKVYVGSCNTLEKKKDCFENTMMYKKQLYLCMIRIWKKKTMFKYLKN